jgi:hypothetical protein
VLPPTIQWSLGFAGDEVREGERRASTNRPIQKYQWTDYMAQPGDLLAYRVLPMVGPDKANLRPDPATASGWTDEVRLSHEVAPGIEALFHRGIVAAQWVSRRLGVTDPAPRSSGRSRRSWIGRSPWCTAFWSIAAGRTTS